jgi:hypothetical protein
MSLLIRHARILTLAQPKQVAFAPGAVWQRANWG